MSKSNSLVKYFKNITKTINSLLVKYFKNITKTINSLLEKNLNKLKLINFINLAKSNKIVLTFVALTFIFISYLLIPTFYKQSEITKELKNELSNTLNLNFIFSRKLNYNFFPRPHFVSNDATILLDNKKVSEIKKILIYVSLENFFSLKNIEINEVVIKDANFELNKENSNFFFKLLENNFINNSLKIQNSNVFFRNIENEVLFINKIINLKYFYEPNELKNMAYSENEIFNIPYSISSHKDIDKKKIYSKLNLELLKLKIDNEYNYQGKIKNGTTYINNRNLKSIIDYEINQNTFEFKLYDKVQDPKFSFIGKINKKPFFSSFEGNTYEINLFHLFKNNAFIPQLLKTEIFNNKNINFKLNIAANKILNFNSFINMILNIKIQEGLIDIDNTKVEWKNYAVFNLFDSLIYIKNGELLLDGKSQIIINNHNEIYKFLLTPKNLRKKIQTIDLDYIYNFDQKIITLSNIQIDNVFDQDLNKKLNNISIKNNDLQNRIYFKNLLNELIKNYAG